MEKNINNTQFFTVQKEPELQVSDVLEIVYKALKEKGYNPVNQIVGIYYVRRSNIYHKPQ